MKNQIVLQGICYDNKSSFMKGPALAPPLIRKAYRSDSANYFSESGLELKPELFEDKGDYAIAEYFEIESLTLKCIEEKRPLISFGGDHSITYPILRAFYKIYGQIDVVHIDAHADLYHEFEGDKYSHACPFARIMEDKIANRLMQIGLRTLNNHQKIQVQRFGVETFEMKDFELTHLPKYNNPIYLSLDLDCLDPAFAPGVSHHEPGGLTTRQLLQIIQKINVPIIGADIVEYNPTRDLNGMTAMVAAKIFKEIAAQIHQNS